MKTEDNALCITESFSLLTMAVTFSGIATASSLQLQSRPYTCPMPVCAHITA